MSLEIRELKLKKARAETAILELEFKIEKAMVDINRMKDHIGLQEDIIKQAEEDISKALKE